MSIDCVILAGGLSSRFPSPLPKVFYPFIDKPLIEHLLDHVTKLAFRKIIVVTGRKTHDYFEAYEKEGLICRVYQQEPAGTWDALITALPAIRSPECVVINGDMPLLDQRILKKIINSNANIALTSTIHPNPIGYGRLMRGTDKQLEAIIEEKHLTGDQYVTNEVNAGLYKFNVDFLKKIEISKNKNAQEWYLTSLWDKGSPYLAETQIIIEDDYRLLAGVNSWQDFEQAEVFYYQLQRESLVKQGVLLKNNQSIYISARSVNQAFYDNS
jgi:bifunctional UDP-N-acetylglucosamine pyrophosphorylase/glucosamine-1-phosphate N-acetyltransferase